MGRKRNAAADSAEPANLATTREAQKQLQAIVARIEKLEEEKAAIADDIADIYAEAKGNGYDVKVLREIIRDRKQATAERLEHEAVKALYMQALGMLADTPLGRAAMERDMRATPDHDSDGVVHEPASHDEAARALGTEEGDEVDDLDPPAGKSREMSAFVSLDRMRQIAELTSDHLHARAADGLDIPANLRRF